MTAAAVTILGGQQPGGVYLLHIAVARPLCLPIGRLHGGRPIAFAAGDYLYVGSALASHGAAALAGRLLRHAARSGRQPPHLLRQPMTDAFAEAGLGNQPVAGARRSAPAQKRLFWHIDYLLDQPAVNLAHVFVLRTPAPLERPLAQMLHDDPHTAIPAPGFGATDDPGASHLFGVVAGAHWWATLAGRLRHLLDEIATP